MGDGDTLPGNCVLDARDFINTLTENIKVYKQIRRMNLVGSDYEADYFCNYISSMQYAKFPHSLIFLYESIDKIDEEFGAHDEQNVVEFMRFRMKRCYEILKQNGMVDD